LSQVCFSYNTGQFLCSVHGYNATNKSCFYASIPPTVKPGFQSYAMHATAAQATQGPKLGLKPCVACVTLETGLRN